jgi:hypothetical protein
MVSAFGLWGGLWRRCWGVMTAGAIMDGARGGIDLPTADVDRIKSHLAKYYKRWTKRAVGARLN